MIIDVVYSVWGADGFDAPFAGGVQEVTDLTDEQLRVIAGAESAGVVRVVSCTDKERKVLNGLVQTQEAGEVALAQAQLSGDWQEGNLQQFEVSPEGYGVVG